MTNAAEYPARVREAFPEAKLSVQSFRDRTVLVVEPADLHDILQHLKDHQGFEFLVDVTAVDYDGYPTPQPGRFGVLWILRNFEAEADRVNADDLVAEILKLTPTQPTAMVGS